MAYRFCCECVRQKVALLDRPGRSPIWSISEQERTWRGHCQSVTVLRPDEPTSGTLASPATMLCPESEAVMRRRDFFATFGAGMVVRPALSFAQQATRPVIGLLSSTTPQAYASRIAAFNRGLSETGYASDKNARIEYRWAEGQYDRLPSLAEELVHLQVNVIAAITTPVALAVKAVTTTIPTVFEVGGDPVKLGLVASFNHPGGNFTGVALLNAELGPKRLELLHQLVPTTTIAALVNPTNPNTASLSSELQGAARSMGLQLRVLQAATDGDIDTVFRTISDAHIKALFIGTDPFFNERSTQLATKAMDHGIAAIYQYRDFAAAGGLLSYGASYTEPMRLVGSYTGRVLKGEKPSDLPVQESTKVELFINLGTAKTLGLTVPQTFLVQADEVIE
jgi:putative tryptophan/tyrosine transport system substrate-binding protein